MIPDIMHGGKEALQPGLTGNDFLHVVPMISEPETLGTSNLHPNFGSGCANAARF